MLAMRVPGARIGLKCGAFAPIFSGMSMHYHVFETPRGSCVIAWSEAGIARFRLPEASAPATERALLRRLPGATPAAPPQAIADVVAAAQRYFAGERFVSSRTCRSTWAMRTRCSCASMTQRDACAGARRRPTARSPRPWATIGSWRATWAEAMAKSNPAHHPVPPARAGGRRQDRRFLRAGRLGDEDEDAGDGRRVSRRGVTGAAGHLSAARRERVSRSVEKHAAAFFSR